MSIFGLRLLRIIRLCAVALGAVVSAAPNAAAQWLHYPTPGIPRTADGKPRLTAPTPKTRDGKPDLSGVWTMVYPKAALARIEKEQMGPYMPDLMPPGAAIPFNPTSAALYKERQDSFAKDRPSSMCLPHAIPDAMLVTPFKLIQTPGFTVVLFEEFNHYRQILTDGRHLPADANPSWFGYSIGKWDHNALIVETTGFNDRSWMDDYGLPHSDALHTTERFERRDFGHMNISITVDDQQMYTRPWSFTLNFEYLPDFELLENICENEKDRAHLIGR
jgi:hypothetical protein